ncbi:MAG: DDE-type integrase/transposase/recombinase [Rhodospirillales bacterium]|nr:DDE-type integrase/transposase/recombinase [Rhodospirillales bacterium]
MVGGAGHRLYLWRAVDSEGEILHILVQCRRNEGRARKVTRKLLAKVVGRPFAAVLIVRHHFGHERGEVLLAGRRRRVGA